MESSPSLGTLHHVEIYVSDLKRSRDFWGWLLPKLGYRLTQSWEEGVSYGRGDTYIVFVQTGDHHLLTAYNRCDVGLNHLAFHAPTREIIDQLTEDLRARGATILYEDRHPYAGGPHYYAVFFEDPDRIKVEIVLSEKEDRDLSSKELMDKLLDFRNARDWEKFHTPENLAKSIAIESGELLEHFQWGDPVNPQEVAEEIADILIYAHLMAHAIHVDPTTIMVNKLAKNEGRFPVAAVRGTSGKHTRVE